MIYYVLATCGFACLNYIIIYIYSLLHFVKVINAKFYKITGHLSLKEVFSGQPMGESKLFTSLSAKVLIHIDKL